MPKFNKKSEEKKTTQNLAGGKAYALAPKLELAFACLTTFLEDKFYESGDERLKRIQDLSEKCSPDFVGKLAVYVRTKANLRSVTTVLLGELAKHEGTPVVAKHSYITRAIVRPDDALELVAYMKGKLTNQVKRGIRNAILKFSPYQLAKYRGEGKEVSMVDVFNLTHPKVQHASKEQKKAWKALMRGELKSEDTWETMSTTAKNDKERKEGWEALILEDKLGYMAMIRNLNNFVKYGIGKKARKAVVAKLTDREEVKKSKQLPFRFFTAYHNVDGDREFSDAIMDAAEFSLDNVPVFEGKTLVAVDKSGSMSGDPIEKAALFAASLIKANKNADLVLYDTDIAEISPRLISTKLPTLTIAQNIMENADGGGTETGVVFKYADGKKYDQIIILSDNESWGESMYGSSTQHEYRKMKVKPNVIAIDIQGYGTTDISDPKAIHVSGWSERIFDAIKYMLKGGTLVQEIENAVQ